MSVKMCYICDQPITRGEPRLFVSGLMIHQYCSPEGDGKLCNVENCAYRWTTHAGEHMT